MVLIVVTAPLHAQDIRYEVDTSADVERSVASLRFICASDSGRWNADTRLTGVSIPRIVRWRGLGHSVGMGKEGFAIEIALDLPSGTTHPQVALDGASMSLRPLGPVEFHLSYTTTRAEVERLAHARMLSVGASAGTLWCPVDDADRATVTALLRAARTTPLGNAAPKNPMRGRAPESPDQLECGVRKLALLPALRYLKQTGHDSMEIRDSATGATRNVTAWEWLYRFMRLPNSYDSVTGPSSDSTTAWEWEQQHHCERVK